MNKHTTIQSLRKQGFKIRVTHSRFVNGFGLVRYSKANRTNSAVQAKGGKTEIDITTPEGKTSSASAVCSSLDTFNRKLANRIALGRALKCLQ